jgi:succinate-semialdehyde dehydrogenase/glutarate-semialdehyde dehydrogenase
MTPPGRTLDHAIPPTGLFIGGSWTGAADGGEIDVVDPATEDIATAVSNGTVSDALAAVAAAYEAQPAWARRPPRERGEILRRAFELMRTREEWFADLIVLENGKAFGDALGEVRYAAEFFRWYAEEAVRLTGTVQTSPAGSNRIVVLPQPIGVAFLVTPWNFPAAMATRKIGPALATGCTVLLKPASDTPLTALAVGSLLTEAGVPHGVVNVVPSRRSGEVAAAVLHDQRVRKLSFTGSTEVGRHLLSLASDQVVSCSMELGGNAPFVVLDDADIGAAVAGAMVAKMRNGGEACTAANRFYVHARIAEEFAQRLGREMAQLRVGPGRDRANEVGPLINAAARDKVAELVDGAVDGGARRLGGRDTPAKGFFYAPTVLTGVSAEAPILDEEIFGPVAPIVAFDSDDEAVAMANDTEHGLVSYVYTTDLGRGFGVAEALESGMVGLNRGLVSDPAAPFGGVKQSGIGREGGHEGVLEYLEPKYIAVEW